MRIRFSLEYAYVDNTDSPPWLHDHADRFVWQPLFGNVSIHTPDELFGTASIENRDILVSSNSQMSQNIGCLEITFSRTWIPPF